MAFHRCFLGKMFVVWPHAHRSWRQPHSPTEQSHRYSRECGLFGSVHRFCHFREPALDCSKHGYWHWSYRQAKADGSPSKQNIRIIDFCVSVIYFWKDGCNLRLPSSHCNGVTWIRRKFVLNPPRGGAMLTCLNVRRPARTSPRTGFASDHAATQFRYWCWSYGISCLPSFGRK